MRVDLKSSGHAGRIDGGKGPERIAVIVPVHNRCEKTLQFLRQFSEVDKGGVHCKVIVVDDGSSDGTSEAISARYPATTILRGQGDLWWTGAVTVGLNAALREKVSHVLLMNDDLEFGSNVLTELFTVAAECPNALVSALKLHRRKDGKEEIITAGYRVSGWLMELANVWKGQALTNALSKTVECDALGGACLLIPRKVFETIGMPDCKRFPHNYGDIEFTRRASIAGYRCITATGSQVFTELNQAYPRRYLMHATRRQYLRNLFENRKYSYGFLSVRRKCFVHRGVLRGSILYVRRIGGLCRDIGMKVLLPEKVLRAWLDEPSLDL